MGEKLISILAHELGHWKLNHLVWGMVFDTFYMLIFAFFLSLCLETPGSLLNELGFGHNKSVFATLIIFTKIWLFSGDFLLRIIINYRTRKVEREADEFAAE